MDSTDGSVGLRYKYTEDSTIPVPLAQNTMSQRVILRNVLLKFMSAWFAFLVFGLQDLLLYDVFSALPMCSIVAGFS